MIPRHGGSMPKIAKSLQEYRAIGNTPYNLPDPCPNGSKLNADTITLPRTYRDLEQRHDFAADVRLLA